MDEFAVIADLFAPLAQSPGAAALKDDVAELTVGGRIIVTTDVIVEGVHFLSADPLGTVAAKLLRVNVSDIHAKGGEPAEALLTVVWPKGRGVQDLKSFADGLREELPRWDVALVGGDTTSTSGPLVLSLTLTGRCGSRGPVRRGGAQAGDELWVTGVIGEGWLGLQAALGRMEGISLAETAELVDAYRRPRLPGPAAAQLVARHASAAMDVSDGLLADALKLAAASNLGVKLRADEVPLSAAGRQIVAEGGADQLLDLLSGGDDYQILMAVAPGGQEALSDAAVAAGVHLTRIGVLTPEPGLLLLDAAGSVMPMHRLGWAHRLGDQS
jgi:thiamine-monophosphate kinase